MSDSPTSKLYVDLDAYAHNLGVVRDRIPGSCGIIAVVKADAYGLGAVQIARRAVSEGVAILGVATVDEGVVLREAGIDAPILVMVHPAEDALGAALKHRLTLMMSDVPMTERLGELARKQRIVAAIHCEVDTGMGRLGMDIAEAPNAILDLTRISNIDIEGIATHFPSADTPNDPYTLNQIKVFRQLLKNLDKGGIPYEVAHAANSAGIANYSTSSFDLVRPGIMTFGVWPGGAEANHPLKPVVRWTSQVVLVKSLPGGASISYDRTYKAPGPMQAAAIPVGYADGFSRKLSNKADVLIRGQRCPVRGNVCMDVVVADVTDVDGVSVGDEVVFIGRQGDESISVEEIAEKAETIPYEVLTGIGPRIQRVYSAS